MVKKGKPARIVFDENDRREFITGFHRRKVERRKKFNEKLERELKEARKRIKLRAREMTKEISGVSVENESSKIYHFEKCYELPEHIVQIRELFPKAEDNQTQESDCDHDKNIDDGPSMIEDDTDVPGMQLNSVRSMKKMVSKQSAALMQRDSAFRKMRKIERRTNRKEAAKKKKVLEKRGKKLTRRRQKR